MSTPLLVMLATGITLYAGVFHAAFARQVPASRWLLGWAASATAFQLARFAQLTTTEPALAVLWSRVFAALAPVMIWLLVRFVMELTGQAIPRRPRRALAAAALAIATIALSTPWVMTNETSQRLDFFGEPYLAPVGGPALALIGIATVAAFAWSLWALARTQLLERGERRAQIVALALYAVLALETLASSIRLVPYPGLAEFAPISVVLSTALLAANRERMLVAALGASISEQNRRLRASEERYRGLVDHAPLGVVVTDQRGDVVTLTERFRKIVGLDESPAPESSDPSRDAPERIAEEISAFARARGDRKATSGETVYTTRSGRRVALKVVVAPQEDAQGRPDGAILLAEDVTERRAVESRLRQSLKLEAIGQLAGGIATGVTTPMAEVRENLAALERGLDELRKRVGPSAGAAARFAEIEQLLAESREGVERAIAIVHDMRELARGGNLAREPLDLNTLLASVVRMAATQRGASVSERYGELPLVVANSGQVRQVLLNLVVNALQAAGASGRVEVETGAERGGACVRVRDSGAGIAAEHRDRIFEPFFTTKPAGEGTGLGLFLSYRIVQAHGGEIRVDSAPGEGATFSVWLPARRAASEGAA